MAYMGPILLFGILSIIVEFTPVVSAISCYSCQYLRNEETYSCVNEPSKYPWTPVVNCGEDVTECQIEYQTLIVDGSIFNVRRACGNPDTSGCQDSGPVNSCHTSCTGELCNDDNIETIVTPPTPGQSTTPNAGIPTTPSGGVRQCYSCTWSLGNPDRNCLDGTGLTRSVACSGGSVCRTFTQYTKSTKEYYSAYRGCDPIVDGQKDECVDSAERYECNKYCSGHLCNTAGPTPAPPDGGGGGGGGRPEGGAASAHAGYILIITMVLIAALL